MSSGNIHTIFGSAMHTTIQTYLTEMYGTSIKSADSLNLGDILKNEMIKEFTQIREKHNVDVFDPLVSGKEDSELNIDSLICNPFKNDKQYDSIVVAVAHDEFKLYKSEDYQKLSNGEMVVIDIKNIVDKPTWRL